MRSFFAAGLFAALLLSTITTGSADSMHASMMMPKCAAGDPVVGVNTATKMYMTHDQMKAKMAGMSDSAMHAMMMKNHVALMCMSKAKSMGASKMMPKM